MTSTSLISKSWQSERRSACAMTQTDIISSGDDGSQFPETNSISTQCSWSRRHVVMSDDRIDFERLTSFLAHAVPLTIKEIEKSIRTFKRWKAMERLYNIGDTKPELLHKFTSDHVLTIQEDRNGKESYVASYVAWNSSTSLFAVAYR